MLSIKRCLKGSDVDNLTTKYDIDIAIRLLKESRILIENGVEDYVCVAIATVVRGQTTFNPVMNYPMESVRSRLRNNIRKALCGYTFVTEWLVARGINIVSVFTHERQYRLLWIDEMIAQLEAMNV